MKRTSLLTSVLFVFSCFLISLSSSAATVNKFLPDEQNTIEIFRQATSKVIYVHRIKTVVGSHSELVHIPSGAGSGIIWDNKGHIVTNFHVIAGADNVAVSIGNHTFQAKIVGTEPRKDIAVLKLESSKALDLIKQFKPFKIARSKDLMVGQKAIAIGNPYGLDHSLTIGVISALGRQVPGVGGVTIRDMIQTDASVNPGNSGGPLLDSSGNLLGINTMIYSKSGSSAGVGFAVPADDIERLVQQIIQHGRVKMAGIGIQRVETRLAQKLGVKRGILISEVIPKTPAAKAGLRGTKRTKRGRIQLGDVIVGVNGKSVGNYDTLYNILSRMPVGETISLTIIRDHKKINLKIKTMDVGSLK